MIMSMKRFQQNLLHAFSSLSSPLCKAGGVAHHISPPTELTTGTSRRRRRHSAFLYFSLSPSLPIWRPFLSQFSIFAPKLLSSGSGDAQLGQTVKNRQKLYCKQIVKLTAAIWQILNMKGMTGNGNHMNLLKHILEKFREMTSGEFLADFSQSEPPCDGKGCAMV